MTSPRLPDWLLYPASVLTLLCAALGHRSHVDAPRRRRRCRPPKARCCREASPIDPAVVVKVQPRRGDDLPAPRSRSPTAGCGSPPGTWSSTAPARRSWSTSIEGVEAKVRLAPRGEAAVLITAGGSPALPLAPAGAAAPGRAGLRSRLSRAAGRARWRAACWRAASCICAAAASATCRCWSGPRWAAPRASGGALTRHVRRAGAGRRGPRRRRRASREAPRRGRLYTDDARARSAAALGRRPRARRARRPPACRSRPTTTASPPTTCAAHSGSRRWCAWRSVGAADPPPSRAVPAAAAASRQDQAEQDRRDAECAASR